MVTRLPWALKQFPRLGDWIRFERGQIFVHTGKVELGQGIKTAISMIAAEELGVTVDDLIIVTGNTSRGPDEQMTAGSMSIEMSGAAVRQAAAEVRQLLVDRAAKKFQVAPADLDVTDGLIRHIRGNQVMSLHEAAGDDPLEDIATGSATPRDPRLYTIVGKQSRRVDLKAKISGGAAYIQDVYIQETDTRVLHGRIVRGPAPVSTLVGIATDVASKMPDVIQVVVDGGFVGVIAKTEWAAIKAKEALAASAQWITPQRLPANLFEHLRADADTGLLVVDGTPLAGELPHRPHTANAIRAVYKKPYYLHGSIGPSAAIARYADHFLTVKSHTQGPFVLRSALAQALAMEESSISVTHLENAGCYGHNGADDAALDAALLAIACPGETVLLKWDREDEHRHEPFSPAMVMSLEGSLAGNRIEHWIADIYSQTHVSRPRPTDGTSGLLAAWHRELSLPRPAPAPAMFRHVGIHRNADPYYEIGAKHIVKHLVRDQRIRTSATRGLGAFGNIFAIESFMDELAVTAGEDPVRFRLAHLTDPRARQVIQQVADEMAEYDPRTAGLDETGWLFGQGMAFARYKNVQTYAAVGVHIGFHEETFELRLLKACIVADAGLVIDPDGLANQLEGGFLQAASWTLKERVQFDEYTSVSSDWEQYPILKFTEVPEVRVSLITHLDQSSLGAGEATQGPTPAAIANALYHATGLRARELPLTPDNLRQLALSDAQDDTPNNNTAHQTRAHPKTKTPD